MTFYKNDIFSTAVEKYATGLWTISLGKQIDPSGQTEAKGILACEPVVSCGPGRTLVHTLDYISAVLIEFAGRLGSNPACLADSILGISSYKLKYESLFLLATTSWWLTYLDPSQETHKAHSTCTVWSPKIEIPSIQSNHKLLGKAVGMAQTIFLPPKNMSVSIALSTPPILSEVAWAESGKDMGIFEALLLSRSNTA